MDETSLVTCACGASLKIPEGAMNMNVRCPKCGIKFVPSEKQIPDALPEDENRVVEPAESTKTIHGTREADSEEPVFSCPNSKCNFVGTVAKKKEDCVTPAFLLVVLVFIWGVSPFILIESFRAARDPEVRIIQMIAMGVMAAFLAFFTFAATIVFAVRVGLNVIGRRFCPKCGGRLR